MEDLSTHLDALFCDARIHLQGFQSGSIVAQNIAESILGNRPSQRHIAQHEACVSCLMKYSCMVFDNVVGDTLVDLLLSGADDGSFIAAQLPQGKPFMATHLHTSKVIHFHH